MSTKNWFRHTTWTTDEQQDFFARLARAHKNKRPQYLYIQATTLLESQKRGNTQAALNLLELCLADYAPRDDEIDTIQQLRARGLEELGQTDAAIEAYRLALRARQRDPQIRSTAPVDFAYLLVRERRTALYAEAMEALTQYADPVILLFPDAQYRYAAACALIAQEAGETERAKEFAAKALDAASKTSSGLSYHPDVGLVAHIDKGIERRLKKILKPGPLGWLRTKR
jgi:tetratricopeptide (TPR) repeat protein